MPIHGDYRMLKIHADVACEVGMPRENTFVLSNGDTLILKNHKITEGSRIPTDAIYIDGNDINGLSTAVIKDRLILNNDGMVAVLISLDSKTTNYYCHHILKQEVLSIIKIQRTLSLLTLVL